MADLETQRRRRLTSVLGLTYLGLLTAGWSMIAECTRRPATLPALDLPMRDALTPLPRSHRSLTRPTSRGPEAVQAPETPDVQAPEFPEPIQAPMIQGPSLPPESGGLSASPRTGLAAPKRDAAAQAPRSTALDAPRAPERGAAPPAAAPAWRRLPPPRAAWRNFRSRSGVFRRRMGPAGREGLLAEVLSYLEDPQRDRVGQELAAGLPVWQACERAGAAQACIDALERCREAQRC